MNEKPRRRWLAFHAGNPLLIALAGACAWMFAPRHLRAYHWTEKAIDWCFWAVFFAIILGGIALVERIASGRLRFTLRTLLLAVPLLAVPFAFIAEARARDEMLRRIYAAKDRNTWPVLYGHDATIRDYLGEPQVSLIIVPPSLASDQSRIVALFPEAVVRTPRNGDNGPSLPTP